MARKIQMNIYPGRVMKPTPGRLGLFPERAAAVMAEVNQIILLIFPDFDSGPIYRVYDDILKLFGGQYPGYRQCNTFYHDLHHTLDCVLVTAKLIHGAFLNSLDFNRKNVSLGLIAAFMHDTGYIQIRGDDTGTGGKYTLCHVARSIDFLAKYFLDRGFSPEDVAMCSNLLRCTGLDVKIAEINFATRQEEILGKILGTADLIGQMSDDHYLEKLPWLYVEFREGGVPGYEDEFDLLRKTPDFWEMVKNRFRSELGGVDAYLRHHYRERWGIDQDLDRIAIEQNLDRLKSRLGSGRRSSSEIRATRFHRG